MRALLPLLMLACNGPSTGDTSDPPDGTDATCDVVDCSDPACAAEEECAWPTELQLVSDLDFEGDTITCIFPVPIDDCQTDSTGTLSETSENPCPSCDRTFAGPLSYSKDSCSELMDRTPPTHAAVGIVFVSATSRELWSVDDAGDWSKAADLTGADGIFSFTTVETISFDIEECSEGVQDLGELTAVLTFTDVK